MKIKTTYIKPPIQDRNYDWAAIDDDTYDQGAPIGYGTTEIQAIASLLEEMVDRERVEDEKLIRELEKRSMSSWTAEEMDKYNRLTGQAEVPHWGEPGLQAPKEIM